MSDLAASGGYYIAMAGHHIVAEPGTLTGSIGIFSGKFVTGGTFQKLGANVESVSSGKFADMNSPVRPYNAEERAKVEEQMQHFYDQFVEKVAQSRKSTPARIDAVAQGRVWTGRQAREIGLVDSLGGLSTALDAAKERAKIPANRDVQLVVFPPRRSFFEVLSEPFGRNSDEGAQHEHRKPRIPGVPAHAQARRTPRARRADGAFPPAAARRTARADAIRLLALRHSALTQPSPRRGEGGL